VPVKALLEFACKDLGNGFIDTDLISGKGRQAFTDILAICISRYLDIEENAILSLLIVSPLWLLRR
jgi:hypothetical protein